MLALAGCGCAAGAVGVASAVVGLLVFAGAGLAVGESTLGAVLAIGEFRSGTMLAVGAGLVAGEVLVSAGGGCKGFGFAPS